MLTAAGALTISYVDRFMIDGFVGRGALGIYTFYSTISIGILSLGASVSHQFLPKIIAAYAVGRAAYCRVIRNFFLVPVRVQVPCWFWRRFLIGPLLAVLKLVQYAQSVAVFFVMLPGILLRILADVPSYALYAARADGKLLYCNLGSAIVSVLLNLMLVPVLGIFGAAVSGGIASAVSLLALTYFALRGMREGRVEPAQRRRSFLPPMPTCSTPEAITKRGGPQAFRDLPSLLRRYRLAKQLTVISPRFPISGCSRLSR